MLTILGGKYKAEEVGVKDAAQRQAKTRRDRNRGSSSGGGI